MPEISTDGNIKKVVLSSIDYNVGDKNGGESLVIDGDFTELLIATSDIVVKFGETSATVIQLANTFISLTTPAGTGKIEISL